MMANCENKHLKITDILVFSEYIMHLFNNAEKYIVFVTSSDAHVPPSCKKRKLELLKALGLKTELQKAYRHSFLAVIDRGMVVIEKTDAGKKLEAEYDFFNHKAKIMSQGHNAKPMKDSPVSVNIDGLECAVSKRGLNFVIFDSQTDSIIDSVAFDTYANDDISRKKVEIDYRMLSNTYRIICDLADINCEFAQHYKKILSQNLGDAEKIYNYLLQNGVFLAQTKEMIDRGIAVFAFEQTTVDELENPTEWEMICQNNKTSGFIKIDPDKYFEISGMSKIYSRDVFEDIISHPVHCEKVRNYYHHIEQNSKYVNVNSLGQRPTQSFPDKPYKTLYVFGDSIACTWEMADIHTLTNQLQELVKDKYRVLNLSVAGTGFYNAGQNMNDLKFEQGDIVVYIWHKGAYAHIKNDLEYIGIDIISLFPYFNAPHSEEIFFDRCHPNPNGYRIISNIVNEKIQNCLSNNCISKETAKRSLPQVTNEALEQWLNDVSKFRPRIGSVVMNCNPFTLGHRYLIEESAAKVDKLYIFVVEEDRSVFPFADRIELVRQGTSDLPNVTVLPSGKYIISSITFTDYFEKSEYQDRIIDPSMDVEIFGSYIAPTLGITVRFAGEEPLDNITKQYNCTMARILPRYDVKFEEIPRKEEGGQVISASRVRRLLETNEFDKIAELVPPTTLRYLKTCNQTADSLN